MARPIANYHRFYASFNKLPKHGDDEEAKAAIVSQYTNGRTTHLHEMRAQEYKECCKALENMLGYGDQRKHWRSICLHLMQELGVFCSDHHFGTGAAEREAESHQAKGRTETAGRY